MKMSKLLGVPESVRYCCLKSGRANGAAKGSCGETVVQKVVLESPFLLCPLKRTLQKHPFGRPFLRTTPSLLLWRAPMKIAQISSALSLFVFFWDFLGLNPGISASNILGHLGVPSVFSQDFMWVWQGRYL